ncbi:hypothetical protein GGX14DRAFT_600477 [Mycena pura]|uniref:Uncharacterized protein n=1 Tax=Mycena pura TaxID=153505 RepID=A0AAD6UP32_9AGAR|nr:hypothetical protein GGX14DRAFT_600477 [Mycena pura]
MRARRTDGPTVQFLVPHERDLRGAERLQPGRELDDAGEVGGAVSVAWHASVSACGAVSKLSTGGRFTAGPSGGSRSAAVDGWITTRTHILSREQAAPEGRIRDDLDAERARGGEHRDVDRGVLDVERERRVLDLHRGDGVHGVCAAKRGGEDFGEAEVARPCAHAPVRTWGTEGRETDALDELGHGADGDLDGRILVRALQVSSASVVVRQTEYADEMSVDACVKAEEIDGVDTQPLKRRRRGRTHMGGGAVDGAVGNLEAELGGEEDVGALARALELSGTQENRARTVPGHAPFPNQVLRIAVHVGGVPERAPGGAADRLDAPKPIAEKVAFPILQVGDMGAAGRACSSATASKLDELSTAYAMGVLFGQK